MELAAALLTDSLPLAHAWRLALTLAAEGFVEREGATLEEAATARFEAEHSQRLLGAVAEVANSRVILTSWVRVGIGADKSADRRYFFQPERGETIWELITLPSARPAWLASRSHKLHGSVVWVWHMNSCAPAVHVISQGAYTVGEGSYQPAHRLD